MADDHLPDVYLGFREDYPAVAAALDGLGEAVDGAGPLDERSARLVKLGLAVGALAEGAVKSNARKALAAGASPEEVRQVGMLADHDLRVPDGHRRPRLDRRGPQGPAEPRRASRRPRPHQPSRPPSRATFSSQMRVIAARTRARRQPADRRGRAGVAQLLAAARAGDDHGVGGRAARGRRPPASSRPTRRASSSWPPSP